MRVANVGAAAVTLLFLLVGASALSSERSKPRRINPSEGLDVIAREPGGWPPPTCGTEGALVEYYSSDGFTYNDDLIIRASGRGSLCWGRQPGAHSGRVEFFAGDNTIERLVEQLRLVYCEGESPEQPQPLGADTPSSWLEFHGQDVDCGNSTAADREAAYLEASDLLGDLVAAVHSSGSA